MTIEVKVPALPESVSDGTLVNWKKKPGEAVKRGENLVDLETDKVVLDIPAPTDGVLGTILRQEGETVTTGDVIATLEESAVAEAAAPAPVATAAAAPTPPPARPSARSAWAMSLPLAASSRARLPPRPSRCSRSSTMI